MTTIKWVSTTSKFFSDPTAWDSGTVPTSSDVAVWDSSSSGDCTLDASIIVDGMKFSGYVGAFKSNNYAITTGSQGWLIPSAMTGTIDLGASTVTNSGNVNWLGVTDAQFLVTLATWIQRGGTLDVPTTWTDTSSRSRSFFSLTFDEGSYAKLIGTLTYSSKDIYVNGAIDIATLLQYYSVAATENGIHIADTGSITGTDFRLYYGKLFGNVSNIKTTGIILRDGFRSAGGDFKSPVTLVAYAAANASFTSAVKFEKSLTLSRQATGAFKVTMNATVEGDVISSGTGTGSYTIVGTVTASGLADQTIDVSAVTSPVGVPVTINKPVGNVTVAGASQIALASDSNFGGKLVFASGFSGTFASNGHAMTCGGFDASSAMTGTIDLGASTVTNSGNVNWLGVTDAQFLVTLATWIQRGGALAAPTTWTDTNSRSRSFFSLTFDEGSYAKLIGSLTYSSKDIYVNGAIDIATMLQYYNVAVTENGIHIADTGSITGTDFRLYYGKLFGNVSNIKTTGIILRDGFRSAGGDFKSPVTLAAYTTSNASFTSAVKFEKLLTLSRQTTGAFKMTMNATVEGDVISSGTGTGSYTIVGTVTASGLADQTIDVSAVSGTASIVAEKPKGILCLNGKYKVAGDSYTYGLSIIGIGGTLSLDGKELHILGSSFDLTKYDDDTLKIDGCFRFSGHEFFAQQRQWYENSILAFDGSCDAKYFSTTGEFQLPGIVVGQSGSLKLPFSGHPTIAGNVASVFYIHGDAQINGAIEIIEPGTCKINMANSNSRFTAGRLTAGRDATLQIDLGSSEFVPNHLAIEGNVIFVWGNANNTVRLAPGDYSAIKCFDLGQNVQALMLKSGEYQFTKLVIETTPDHEFQIASQESNATIKCDGALVMTGMGTCRTEMQNFLFDHVEIDTTFYFGSETITIRHPNITSNGKITGKNLIVKGTSAFQMSYDQAIDVETLTVQDGDKTLIIPHSGYEHLVLEALEDDSFVTLNGSYQVRNLQLKADGRILTVDVTQAPQIMISGNMTSQCLNGGAIRILGNGSERWVFNGNANQSTDLQLEHGHHYLGRLVNTKTSGTITVNKQLDVVRFQDGNGNDLSPLANMTVLSTITMTTKLFLISEGKPDLWQQNGNKLENAKVSVNGVVELYAKIVDHNDEPINPKQIESVLFSCKIMNPIAPHLHPPRKIMCDETSLPVGDVMLTKWESNATLGTEVYNLHFSNCDWEQLRFDEPGLYYVTLGIKLFGHKKTLPLRYEIYCDRND